ncbi:MAG TPA: FtsK/SpoIIIE domain-containing protein [Actinomycetes bacterium]|nr:FtsK/SpoIIIE domain-containing protein [Actinomycetes bacterium]
MSLKFKLGTADGRDTWLDLAKLPHLLVAGTTGSGKSVFLNSLLLDLIGDGAEARYILIDPKRVEFAPYKPFVTYVYVEDDDVVAILTWAAQEMDERFERLERRHCRDLDTYNEISPLDDQLPRLVIVIDELANLMLGPAKDRVQLPLTRLAQMARAVGIHLVLATQRPTTDVVTGLLKANIPARVSFQVVSQIDSRVILDQPGAENLLGAGDMLARIPGVRGLQRLKGRNVSIEDVEKVIKQRTEVR